MDGKKTKEYLKKFVGRVNPYALQLDSGAYIPIHKELTDIVLEQHLSGLKTLGTYVIREDMKVSYGVIDIDGEQDNLEPLKQLGHMIYSLFPEFKRVLEFSGRRGYHVWIFMDKLESPKFVKELLTTRLKLNNIRNIEVFPKQDNLSGKKLGNLIKLPCGKHKKGGWSKIIKEDL